MGKKRTASRYVIRENALAAMGFANYPQYLNSELWATIRARILARDKKLCIVCGKRPARAVHHVTYAQRVMEGNDDAQLLSICGGCHKTIEFDWGRKLLSTTEIHEKLFRAAINRRGGGASKKYRTRFQPRCRCCRNQKRQLGREDICMECFRSGRATAFVQAAGT